MRGYVTTFEGDSSAQSGSGAAAAATPRTRCVLPSTTAVAQPQQKPEDPLECNKYTKFL
jgi:hypothetical protein